MKYNFEDTEVIFKLQKILIVILRICGLIMCFEGMQLAIEYEELQEEKLILEGELETKESMICDLEENCKDLFMQLEGYKYGN